MDRLMDGQKYKQVAEKQCVYAGGTKMLDQYIYEWTYGNTDV